MNYSDFGVTCAEELEQDEWSLSRPTFETPNGGVLTVVGWKGKECGKVKLYVVFCPVCARDPELFGQGVFRKTKGKLKRGLPCGCGKGFRYTDQQWEVLAGRGVKRAKCDSKKARQRRRLLPNYRPRRKKTTEEFIKDAKAIHGDLYDYSQTEYINAFSAVKIICPQHGPFMQKATNHLQGRHCLFCAGHTQKQCYIHIIKDREMPTAIKFGIANNWKKRLRDQNSNNLFYSVNLGVWEFSKVSSCKNAERECKKTLKTGFLSAREMKDGWTETVSVLDLEKVIAIYEKHGGKRIK